MRTDLDTLINDANQAFDIYLALPDKSKDRPKKVLEGGIRTVLQILQHVFNGDGTFKDSIAERDRPELVAKIKDFFNPLVPKLMGVYETHYVNLTESAITDLTSLSEVITNIKEPGFSNALSTIFNAEVKRVRQSTIRLDELKIFFENILQRDRYRPLQYDRNGPTDEAKKAVTDKIIADVGILRAMLDNQGIGEEDIVGLIGTNWESLVDRAPPRSFLQLSHTLKQ